MLFYLNKPVGCWQIIFKVLNTRNKMLNNYLLQGNNYNYYNHVKLRFTVNGFTTNWQRMVVGLVTGCTISVILFAAEMYMVVRSVEKENRGPVTQTKIRQPPVRAFIDDLTITAKSVVEARWTLQELEYLIKWAWIKFKPVESRSLVIKSGKVEDRFRFKIGK